ncbi:loricrin-like [Salvia hispanica]|uniref:loricrin-like n=1 Tax=Salvia hispanica TaxID=49212 RepID=UPI0020099073|nr:loricrin-like [Salvia hispanica]
METVVVVVLVLIFAPIIIYIVVCFVRSNWQEKERPAAVTEPRVPPPRPVYLDVKRGDDKAAGKDGGMVVLGVGAAVAATVTTTAVVTGGGGCGGSGDSGGDGGGGCGGCGGGCD